MHPYSLSFFILFLKYILYRNEGLCYNPFTINFYDEGIMRFNSFSEMISYRAGLTPEDPALRYEELGLLREMSWSSFEKLVTDSENALPASFSTGFFLNEPSPGLLALFFAAVRTGRRIVLLDANAPEEVLRAQILETGIDALLGDEELAEELSDALSEPAEENADRGILFYTSGTTSRQKAVVLTEKSLCASAYNGGALLPLTPSDNLLSVLPLNHVFGFVCGLLWGLSCGASVSLGRGPRHYADDCAFFRPTAVSVVPLLLGFFLQRGLLNDELKLILIGAGDCPAPLITAAKTRGVRVSFGYGLTETSSGVALSLGDDPYAMTVCPDDIITIAADGEILIEAPTCVMQGYFRRPEETEAVLQNGVLHTGDLGRFDEKGLLHITGRKKEILVLPDGTKIYLPEYEQDLSQALPGRDLAVFLWKGNPILLIHGDPSEKEELFRKIRGVVSARPRGQQIKDIFFSAKPLPRTAAGKLRRWELNKTEEVKA